MVGLPRRPAPHSLPSPDSPHWPHHSASFSRDSQGRRLSLPMVSPPPGCSQKGSGWLSGCSVHHLSRQRRAVDAVVSIALTDPTPIRSARCPAARLMGPIDLRPAARRDEEDHRRRDGARGAAGRAGGRRAEPIRTGRSGAPDGPEAGSDRWPALGRLVPAPARRRMRVRPARPDRPGGGSGRRTGPDGRPMPAGAGPSRRVASPFRSS